MNATLSPQQFARMAQPAGKGGPIPCYPYEVPLEPGESYRRYLVRWSREKHFYVRIAGRYFENYRNTGRGAFVFSEPLMDVILICARTGLAYRTIRDKSWLDQLPARFEPPTADTRAAAMGTKRTTHDPAREILCDTDNFFVWYCSRVRIPRSQRGA